MNLKGPAFYSSRILFPRSQKKSTGNKSIIGAVICIALSVIPLVTVVNVGDAMIAGIMERMVNLSSSHIEAVFVPEQDTRIDIEELVKKSSLLKENIRQINYAYPVIQSQALAATAKARCGAQIRAMDMSFFESSPTFAKYFTIEETVSQPADDFQENDIPKVYIGAGIAQQLGLKPGMKFNLITTKKSGKVILPKRTACTVKGLISCGYQELDNLWVIFPIEKAVEIFSTANVRSSLFIETSDPFSPQLWQVQNRIEQLLDYDATVYRWDELNRSQYENFVSTKLLLIFIMILIVAVACVNISSCLVMLVMERSKEIAILKSTGATNSLITASFLLSSVLIGGAGVLTGISAGIAVSLGINGIILFFENIINFFAQIGYLISNGTLTDFNRKQLFDSAYYLEEVRVNIQWAQIAFVFAGTLFLSLLAGIIPSIKAGKQRPREIFSKAGS